MKKFTAFTPPTFLLVLVLFVSISCNQPNNQQKTLSSETEQFDLNVPVMYTGTLPCADCPGINYQLILDEGQFTEISHYQDRSAESFEESGTWEIAGDTLTLVGSEDLILKRFLFEEDSLRLLDRNNQQITGSLSDMYVLDRVGDQESIQEHHQGLAEQRYTFFATGNEPFWSIKIDSLNQVMFESPEMKVDLGILDPSVIKSEMQFEISTDSTQLSVQITDEYCQDSMSGYLFPLTITATMQPSNVDSLKGCGLFPGS